MLVVYSVLHGSGGKSAHDLRAQHSTCPQDLYSLCDVRSEGRLASIASVGNVATSTGVLTH